MNIDWTLLLLLVIAALGVLGLVIALQTNSGKKRLADAALRLAESLITYAIRWLEGLGTGAADVLGVAMIEAESHDLDRARAAQACLRAVSIREIQPDGTA